MSAQKNMVDWKPKSRKSVIEAEMDHPAERQGYKRGIIPIFYKDRLGEKTEAKAWLYDL